MKIIIVGSGKVGYSLAESLSSEDNDIILIDKDPERLRKASDNLDVLCVEGSGASTKTLSKVGVEDADVLLAVTSKDETNMICSLVAHKMGVKHTVARVRDPEYLEDLEELKKDFGLDMIINPEQALAYDIARFLEAPTARTIDIFEQGNMEVVEIEITEDMPIANKRFENVNKKHKYASLFKVIYRNNEILIPKNNTLILPGDLIYIIGWYKKMFAFYSHIGVSSKNTDNVMIIGGGRVAFYFCKLLKDVKANIKIIELKKDNASFLAENLEDVLIINGDGSDYNLLHQENIEKMDSFIALTGRDEDNLMAALLAKQNGVKKVVAKISRIEYINVINKLEIDYIVSPKPIATKSILRYIRGLQKTMTVSERKLYKTIGKDYVVFEFNINNSFKYLDIKIRNLKIIDNTYITAIIRNKQIVIPWNDDVIKENDVVVVISSNQNIIDFLDIFEDGDED